MAIQGLKRINLKNIFIKNIKLLAAIGYNSIKICTDLVLVV